MAISTTDIQDFTDSEIVRILRMALVNSAIAQQYSIGGRSLMRSSPSEINRILDVFEKRVADDSTGGTAVIEFGNAQ